MSIFKRFTTTQDNTELVDSSNYSANANITISQIKVTNHGSFGECLVEVFLKPDGGGDDNYIFKTVIPENATLIYDEPFSYPNSSTNKSTLSITTGTQTDLTVVIN